MTELTIQLGTVFLTNMFIGQAQEVGIPWIYSKLCLFKEKRTMMAKKMSFHELSDEEEQAKKFSYPSAFDDYNEIVIQYGYCILFAAAFPAAPLFAWLNNIVEMRTDGLKLLQAFQRPHPRGAKDIGRWQSIMTIMSHLSVFTNMLMLLYTSSQLKQWFPKMGFSELVWIVVITEHCIFLLRWLMEMLVPDSPGWVTREYARRKFWKHYYLYNKQIGVRKDEILEDRRVNLETAPLLK